MKRYTIMLLNNHTMIRNSFLTMLLSSEHQIKLVDHCVDLLREARRIRPDLVLVPYREHDAQLAKTVDIIESDRLSSVCYLVDKLSTATVHALRRAHLGAYIPLDSPPALFLEMLNVYAEKAKFFLESIDRIDQLELDISNRKTIDEAKRLLMKKWNLPEDKAYQIMRKRAMDRSVKLITIAEIIIEENQ